jgi:hypothetical protein
LGGGCKAYVNGINEIFENFNLTSCMLSPFIRKQAVIYIRSRAARLDKSFLIEFRIGEVYKSEEKLAKIFVFFKRKTFTSFQF